MNALEKIIKVPTKNVNFKESNTTEFFQPMSTTADEHVSEHVVDVDELNKKFEAAREALLMLQQPDGHWCYPLEADCTIPAEYILMMHFLDEVDVALENRIARFIREKQDIKHGGWPLYFGGHFDISCTIKSYYALKLVGDSPNDAHMVSARNAILAAGGAACANVFTRIMLAMFEQIPWRGAPVVPVELILLPRWFPFHISKISYWSRTVMVPLSILCSLKASAVNPRGIHIRELFTVAPEEEKNYFPPVTKRLAKLFMWIEHASALFEPYIPKAIRRLSIRRAERWTIERLNSECGVGAIFPAMVNAYEALTLLGYAKDNPLREQCRKALLGLLVEEEGDRAWCQPCTSPIWDTVLTSLALQEDQTTDQTPINKALDWLIPHQILEAPGDWRDNCPDLPGGGWAFQYANPHYPDLDDTAAVAWALDQSDAQKYHESIERAANWLTGMQSSNGGFAAFNIDNTYHYLNEIPFADHGALIDPPTSDVTARCVGFLAKYGQSRHTQAVQRGMKFLFDEQEKTGAWFGRWGSNYVYGTWSVLEAFQLAKLNVNHYAIRRAVQWLKSVQREDGGWGESNDTYFTPEQAGQFDVSTYAQTAWALLGLMAVGEVHSQPVRDGVNFLLRHQADNNLWQEPWFNAPGFPRVFYLKYHGYSRYFPVWALARYRVLTRKE